MTILVTGGASGLGEAITKQLATSGHQVYFTYCHSAERAKAIEAGCTTVKAIHCDFKNTASVDALLQQVEAFNIQALVNNALGGLDTNYFHKTDPDHFAQSFMTNIMPVIRLTQKCILHFRKQKSGKIITILSSYIVNKPPAGLSAYVAEKNYLLSLSKSWASENAKFGITSNCISPAMMQTALTASTDERIIEEMVNQHPLKRLLSPAEVAEAVLYMVNATPHLNGSNMIMNAASDLI